MLTCKRTCTCMAREVLCSHAYVHAHAWPGRYCAHMHTYMHACAVLICICTCMVREVLCSHAHAWPGRCCAHMHMHGQGGAVLTFTCMVREVLCMQYANVKLCKQVRPILPPLFMKPLWALLANPIQSHFCSKPAARAGPGLCSSK